MMMMTIIITACVGRTIISDAILSLEEFGPQRRYNWMLELVIIILSIIIIAMILIII